MAKTSIAADKTHLCEVLGPLSTRRISQLPLLYLNDPGYGRLAGLENNVGVHRIAWCTSLVVSRG